MGLFIIGFVVLIVVCGALFIWLSPQFGGSHTAQDKLRYAESVNYGEGQFENLIPTSLEMSAGKMGSILRDQMKGDETRSPSRNIEVESVDSTEVVNNSQATNLIWFGHSAFLLQIDGKRILLDPMLGDTPSPLPFFVAKRYSKELPIEIEKLPEIDAILLSHDHYDHLDHGSILKLKEKTKEYYVPLGVGAHLKSWGIPEEDIHEMDWWDETTLDGLNIAFAPARHFSGRGITDRNKTLWGSWVIQGQQDSIYFSGDGGYGPHFKEIGEKYGPFDFAMMECGQYDERWNQIHMMPEETAQAAIDVDAKQMMPIHWGAFTLALHSWVDPVERVTAKAEELNMPVITPKIGEWIYLGDNNTYSEKWWRNN